MGARDRVTDSLLSPLKQHSLIGLIVVIVCSWRLFYDPVVAGHIAAVALVLFYWENNAGYYLHNIAADTDWLDTGGNLGCLRT